MNRRGFLRFLGLGAGMVAAGGVTVLGWARQAPDKLASRRIVAGGTLSSIKGAPILTDRELEFIPQDEFTRLSQEFIRRVARAQDRRIMGIPSDVPGTFNTTWSNVKQMYRPPAEGQ